MMKQRSIASVATAFPTGRTSLAVRLADVIESLDRDSLADALAAIPLDSFGPFQAAAE